MYTAAVAWRRTGGSCGVIDLDKGAGDDVYCRRAEKLGLPPCDEVAKNSTTGDEVAKNSTAAELAAVQRVCAAWPDCGAGLGSRSDFTTTAERKKRGYSALEHTR